MLLFILIPVITFSVWLICTGVGLIGSGVLGTAGGVGVILLGLSILNSKW